jgi:allophanate hydrolase
MSRSFFSITQLQAAYRHGFTPRQMIDQLLPRLADDQHGIWISLNHSDTLYAYADRLAGVDPASLPLYGIPFAIKDNIDLVDLPTTAGCPDFAYQPSASAFVVQRLIDAGAIPLGKTNLDQFATGLNGTRTPYAMARNSIDPDYIAGGSSSGSALAVALGLASFSLGTDTAGSGRVPAAFNQLIGVKPSCGLLSTRGVVPACRSLDCVSIFAQTTDDADAVLRVASQFDAQDSYSKAFRTENTADPIRVIGVPKAKQLQFFGDDAYAALFEQAKAQAIAQGFTLVEIDFGPFLDAAKLLYHGAWVAERLHALQGILSSQPDAVLPVIRQIVEPAANLSAVQTFDGFYQLAALKRLADQVLGTVDAIMTPTAGTIYTIAQMQADPLALNNNLGYYTNFMNLLDYAALAIPAGTRADGLPFGITLFAHAGSDHHLLNAAQQFGA